MSLEDRRSPTTALIRLSRPTGALRGGPVSVRDLPLCIGCRGTSAQRAFPLTLVIHSALSHFGATRQRPSHRWNYCRRRKSLHSRKHPFKSVTTFSSSLSLIIAGNQYCYFIHFSFKPFFCYRFRHELLPGASATGDSQTHQDNSPVCSPLPNMYKSHFHHSGPDTAECSLAS